MDTCALIAAFEGTGPTQAKAFAILNDASREIVCSEFLRLETVCKPIIDKNEALVKAYTAFFDGCSTIAANDAVVKDAIRIRCAHNIKPMDAIHLSVSLSGKVDEFVTAEKATSEIFRARGEPLTLTSIHKP